ncbi:MAG: hypothetical protein VB070_01650 [Clostridiaceae bacterium]|nr:hypothetical protein [Clostridiaceae bacterium]
MNFYAEKTSTRSTIQTVKRASLFQSLYSVSIALIPLLTLIHPIAGLDTSSFLMLLFAAYILLRKLMQGNLLQINKEYAGLLLWCVYIVITFTFGILLNTNNVGTAGAGATFFQVLFILAHVIVAGEGEYRFSLIRKTVVFVSVLASAIVIIQTLTFYLSGRLINPIPYWMLNTNISNVYIHTANRVMSGLYRPSAFFLEPAHMAQYVSVGIAFLIYVPSESRRKRDLVLAIMCSIALVLTTSGLGIATVFCIWLFYFQFSAASNPTTSRSRLRKNWLLIDIVGIALLVIIYNYLSRFAFFQSALGRVFTGQERSGAIWGRLSSFGIFTELPLMSRIFGIGFGRESTTVFMTGLSSLLVQIGYVGTALFFYIIIKKLSRAQNLTLCLGVLFLALFCLSDIYNFSQLTFYLIIIYASSKTIPLQSKSRV